MRRILRQYSLVPMLLWAGLFGGGCANTVGTVALGAVGATAVGSYSPSSEIEVIYYLGVFDPQDQVPPTVYRIRVHGQASFISFTRFASGWVRAELIDSLSTGGRFDGTGITVDESNSLTAAKLQTGRRLVMFGPEGFREAPKDHRLVIVMGADPTAFFQAMDRTLGEVSAAQASQADRELVNRLFLALAQAKAESDRLNDLFRNVSGSFPPAP